MVRYEIWSKYLGDLIHGTGLNLETGIFVDWNFLVISFDHEAAFEILQLWHIEMNAVTVKFGALLGIV